MIEGTNCFNCKFIVSKSKSVTEEELNKQGGIDAHNAEELQRQKKADLITLPGSKLNINEKKFCDHKEIEMYVTERMCCAYWDNEGVNRIWKST